MWRRGRNYLELVHIWIWEGNKHSVHNSIFHLYNLPLTFISSYLTEFNNGVNSWCQWIKGSIVMDLLRTIITNDPKTLWFKTITNHVFCEPIDQLGGPADFSWDYSSICRQLVGQLQAGWWPQVEQHGCLPHVFQSLQMASVTMFS